MMSTCNEVQDELADLVAGDREAIARHSEHLASCDACRDARHEATELAAKVGTAGSDHVSPDDLVARVLAAASLPAPAKDDVATASTVAMEAAKVDVKPADVKPIAANRDKSVPRVSSAPPNALRNRHS